MSILLGLLAAMSVVGGLLWRLNSAAHTARDAIETANDVRGLTRRWWWQRKFAQNPLDLVDDPRTAAVAMMVATAHADGALTERERAAIIDACTGTFGATLEQAEQMFAHARWLTKDVRDLDRCFKRLQPVLRKGCSPDELRDVLSMVRQVANADGTRDAIVDDAVARLARELNFRS